MESAIYTYATELTHALSWTLLHSIWQGFTVAILLLAMLKFGKRCSANTKYIWAVSSLLILFLGSMFTFCAYLELPGTNESITIAESTSWNNSMHLALSEDMSYLTMVSDYINSHSRLISMSWLIGLSFFILRILFGIAQIQKLKKSKSDLSEFWIEKLELLKNKAGFNQVILLGESPKISSPLTFGFLKPVLLFPIGMVNQLSIEQVEAIMAHEVAHIIRKDYLVNLIQTFIESIYYFNPSVWVISTIIRNQREHCCDDLAIALTGSSIHYVKALVAIEESNNSSTSILAMALSKNKKPLLNRVRRILNQPQKNENMKEKLLMCTMLFISVLFFSMQAKSSEKNIVVNESTIEKPTEIHVATDSIPLADPQDYPKDKTNNRYAEVETTTMWIKDEVTKDFELVEVPIHKDRTPNGVDRITSRKEYTKTDDNPVIWKNGTLAYKYPQLESDGDRFELKETDISKDNTTSLEDIAIHGGNFELVETESGTQWVKKKSPNELNDTSKQKLKLEKQKEKRKSQKENLDVTQLANKQKLYANFPSRDTFPDFDDMDIDEYIREATQDMEEEFEKINIDGEVIQKEIFEDLRQRSLELRENLQDLIDEKVFIQEEIRKEIHEEISDYKEDLWADLRDMHENLEDLEIYKAKNSISDLLEKQLLQDGLIDDPEDFSFKIKNQALTINGKEQPTSIYEKYTAFLSEHLNGEWTANSRIKIVRKNGSHSSSISIEG